MDLWSVNCKEPRTTTLTVSELGIQMLLYVHRDGELRTATSAFTQLLCSDTMADDDVGLYVLMLGLQITADKTQRSLAREDYT